MRVFVAGGTGYVGGYVLEELERQGHKPVALVRPGSEEKLPNDYQGEIVSGDIFNFELPSDSDAVIYSIGLLREVKRKGITFEKLQFEGAKALADAALAAGIKRYILQSANGVKPDGTKYQYTKFLAEEYIKSKDFDWTIFRPSFLFGDPAHPSGLVGKPEFCTMLSDKMIRPRIPAPLFHPGLNLMEAGKFKLQPLHVSDLARGIVACLGIEKSMGRMYLAGGKDEFTWHEIIDTIAQAVGRKKWKLPAPGWAVKLAAFMLPITRDQVTMLMEGNTCDSSDFFSDFEIDPIAFESQNLTYLS